MSKSHGSIKSTYQGSDPTQVWSNRALQFSYGTDGDDIKLYTTGGLTVTIKAEGAGQLVALLISRFPSIVLDVLANVKEGAE